MSRSAVLPFARLDWFERQIEWLSKSKARSAAALLLLSLALFLPGFVSLQPMDRDEPRFAQASKQMLETGDFVDIRFQEEARHKKPVGIYWLQAASVAAAEAVGFDDARRTIALYRLPSLAGALATVLLSWWAARAFLSAQGALLVGALMASCLLLGVEARLAKTDAVLTATVVAAMAALARVWFAAVSPRTVPRPGLGVALVFWLAIGIGILVKGPITVMVVGLAIIALSIRERSMRWLLPLRPLLGVALVAVLVLPWLIAITLQSNGGFFAESLGRDMLGKVAEGQEKHWGPPGLYLVAFWATAWPLAPFVALAFSFMWRDRRDDAVAFCLAWVVPSWLVFEAVPTKLPHYVLPLYPALAILAVMAAERERIPFHWRSAKLAALLLLLVPLALLIGAPIAVWRLDGTLPFFALPLLAVSLSVAILGVGALQQGRIIAAVGSMLLASGCAYVAAYPFGVASVQSINLSRRLADVARNVECPMPAFASAGYNEPSLVFLTDTTLRIPLDGRGAAQFFSEPGCRIAFVERRQEAAFIAGLVALQDRPALRTRIAGINLNGGRKLDIGVYVRER